MAANLLSLLKEVTADEPVRKAAIAHAISMVQSGELRCHLLGVLEELRRN